MTDPLYCPWFLSAPCLKPEVWAAWWQALGSVVAILIAVAVPATQHWLLSEARRREAADRARSLGLQLLPHIKAMTDSNSDIWSHENPDHDVTNHADNACYLGSRTRFALVIPKGITREVGRLHELGRAAEGIQRAIYNIERAKELLTEIDIRREPVSFYGDNVERKTLILDKEQFYDLVWDALRGLTSSQDRIESFFKHDSRPTGPKES